MAARSPFSARQPMLVGRDRELTILHDRLTAARDGRGALVLISGEAGIGKTALVDALAREAEDLGAQVLAGHCYDRTEMPPYGPWIKIAAGAAPLGRLEEIANRADLFAQTRDFLTVL